MQVTREFQLDESQSFSMYRSPGYRDELSQNELTLPLQVISIRYDLSLLGHVSWLLCHVVYYPCTLTRHGDMLYLSETGGSDQKKEELTGDVAEDEIDRLLRKKDGMIQRKRDPQL